MSCYALKQSPLQSKSSTMCVYNYIYIHIWRIIKATWTCSYIFNMDIIDMNLRCINKHHSTNSVSSSSTPPWALHPSSLPDPPCSTRFPAEDGRGFRPQGRSLKKNVRKTCDEYIWLTTAGKKNVSSCLTVSSVFISLNLNFWTFKDQS